MIEYIYNFAIKLIKSSKYYRHKVTSGTRVDNTLQLEPEACLSLLFFHILLLPL